MTMRSLGELHARRLATVVTLVEDALQRIEMVLRNLREGDETPTARLQLTPEQMDRLRQHIEAIRRKLKVTTGRFSVRPSKPEPRQVLGAELSSLWVILENAMPKRMKGYGREFDPTDKTDWESSIHGLLHEVQQIRKIILG